MPEDISARRSRSPAQLEPIETASRDEISALQLTRLRWTLQHAYDNVAHYRAAFDENGVHPSDLKDLSDLALFPCTTKADLRDHYPFGMFAVPQTRVARLHASSGTTGRPVVVGYTAADLDNWAALVARSLRAGGVRAGDKVHIAYGYGLFTGGLGVHAGAERLGCTVVPVSGGMTERQVQLIDELAPDAILCTPSYMLTILDQMQSCGMDTRSTSLRTGVFGAEPWTLGMRAELEDKLGIDAVDIYGLSEVMGPGVAQECVETKDGLHIWEDHFYPEIIDPNTHEVLPDGSLGELVFTSLTKQAFPVVRYRTRDLTRLLPGTARSMRRLAKISGRSDDMIILRGVNLFPTQIEELICGMEGLAPQFVCVLERPGRLDTLTVEVECRPGVSPQQRLAAGQLLRQQVKDRIGVSISVEVVEPGSVRRSTGKATRLVDRRPQA
jgi:phenylacetate-CoA ligase